MKLSPWLVKGEQKGWRVAWRANRRTLRRYFPTKDAASTFATALKDELAAAGPAFSALTAYERIAVLEAYRRAKDRGYTLTQACDAYESQVDGASGIGLGELISRHLAASKPNMRANSYGAKRRTLQGLGAAFGGRSAQSIQPSDLREFIGKQDWGPYRIRGWLVDVSALFNWGIREGLLARNPTRAVERPPTDDGPVAILTVDQAKALLKAATPEVMPKLALGLFAGMRSDEIHRFHWEKIKWSQGVIEIDPIVSKTRQRRLIPILPALDRYLSPVVRKSGKVYSRNAWVEWKQAHPWPKNALRHSWISYRLAIIQDVQRTALEAGNTPEVVFSNYRELVTREDANRFFAL